MTSPAPVADDADRAVELDVVEALGLGLGLERVSGVLVLERCVVVVAEVCVPVQRDLAVECLQRPSARRASGFTSTRLASSR
jgi:hypothetical protein